MSEVKTTLKREGDLMIAHTQQDVEAIVDNNKRLQGEKQKRGRAFHHAASIPNNIYYNWMVEAQSRGAPVDMKWNGPEMEGIVKEKINDPNWKYLRADAPQQTYTNGAKLLVAKKPKLVRATPVESTKPR